MLKSTIDAPPAEGLYIHINRTKSLSYGFDSVRGSYRTPAKLDGPKGEPATDAQKKLIGVLSRKRGLEISYYQMPANKGQASELIDFLNLPQGKAPACRTPITKPGDAPMHTFQASKQMAKVVATTDGIIKLAEAGDKLTLMVDDLSPDPSKTVTVDVDQVKFLRDQLSLWLAQNGGK